MLSENKVAEQSELQDAVFSAHTASEAVRIEEVLNRAHQIHRAHGGLIGYDLEDWLQAERELIERNRPEHFQAEETPHVAPLPRDQERNRKKCFGLNN